MSIKIKEVTKPSEWKTFIYLPEKIHKNHKTWLPPLYMDEKKVFSAKKNPAFHENKVKLFLAYDNGKAVGRVMGIIPKKYNEKQHVKSVRFSYLECYEDFKIFSALIETVKNWGKEYGCTEMVGPMGFSDKEPQGFLIKGFNEPTMMVTNSSLPYMKIFIEQESFSPLVKLCEYDVPIDNQIIERYEKFAQRVKRNLKVKVHNFTKTKDIKPFVSSVFDLINESYQEIYGFTSVTEKEKAEFANRFLPLLNPKLIKIITNEAGKVIAFVVAMPDMSEGIRKAKGRLFPLGWYHILKAFKTTKRLVLLLGGISPAMQNKGLDAILAIELFRSALTQGFTTMDSHLIMEENLKMRREIERLEGFRLYKEYQIYRKEI